MSRSLAKTAHELERIRRLMEAQAAVRAEARPMDTRRAAIFWFVLMFTAILLWQIVRTGR